MTLRQTTRFSTAIVFAVLQDFVDNCSFAYAALGQRLRRGAIGSNAGWRWPVLRLDDVNSTLEPKEFVKELVGRHEAVLKACGVQMNGTRHAILDAGLATLDRHAGSDYKRYVVKRIASMSLGQLS